MSKENKYYVYLHRRLDGSVFYVGKGTAERYKSRQSRSKVWKAEASKGYSYQILKNGMSNREASLLEEELIQIYRATIVNDKSSKLVKELSFEKLDKVFYYDETSPSGLRWKVDRFKNKGAKLFSAGDVAGNKKYLPNGVPRCWKLKLMGINYMVHRIIWLLLNKTIDPEKVIDHLDGNAFNNNISNLAEKTHADNARNRKRIQVSKSGTMGVGLRVDVLGIKHFRANWRDEFGKSQWKSFSARKYGESEAHDLALAYRNKMIEELKAKGFDYTNRHIGAE